MRLAVQNERLRNAVVLSEAPAMAEAPPCAAAIIHVLTGVEFAGMRFGRAGDQSFRGHGIPSLCVSLSVQSVPFPCSCLFLMSRRMLKNKAGWSTMGICPAFGMM